MTEEFITYPIKRLPSQIFYMQTLTTYDIFKEMLENQQHLNSTAYSDTWLEKGLTREWDYVLAADQEIGEFINSYWQPWWSKSEQDMANCRIEIVDALHFLLSEMIIRSSAAGIDGARECEDAYEEAQVAMINGFTALDYARHLRLNLAMQANPAVLMMYLFRLCKSIDFSLMQLNALYIGKSVLNKFRQDNGYKLGTYAKKWDGVKEDNYFLSLWVAEQKGFPTKEQIYQFLSTEYAKYVK